jgi:hypothetical protein
MSDSLSNVLVKAVYIHGPDQWRYVETPTGMYTVFEYNPISHNWDEEPTKITQEEARRQVRDFLYSGAYNVNAYNFGLPGADGKSAFMTWLEQ